jgi:hypothetical protein
MPLVFDTEYRLHKRGGHAVDYHISDSDESGTVKYYGYVNATGGWYILKDGGDGTYRYAIGKSTYTTNWTGRVALTYYYFYELFE